MIKLINEEFFTAEEALDKKSGKLITRIKMAVDENRIITTVIYDEIFNKHPTKIKAVPDPKFPKKTLVKISQREDLEFDTDVYVVAIPVHSEGIIVPVPRIKGLRFYRAIFYTVKEPFKYNDISYDKILYFIMTPDIRYINAVTPIAFDIVVRTPFKSGFFLEEIWEFYISLFNNNTKKTKLELSYGNAELDGNLEDYDEYEKSHPLPLFRPRLSKDSGTSPKEYKNNNDTVSNKTTYPKWQDTSKNTRKKTQYTEKRNNKSNNKHTESEGITQDQLEQMLDNAFKEDPSRDRYMSTGRKSSSKRRRK